MGSSIGRNGALDRASLLGRCAQLLLRTIVEFVENDAIFDQRRQIGVDFAQGFALWHPLPLAELVPTR
jgi:EAL domain-containing protein (putative c-di-GMP-specific phosphodiesterase class I)